MRGRYLILALLFCSPLFAQVNNPSIVSVSSAPSGVCSPGLPNRQVTSTGIQYSCQNGNWAIVGGGGGSTSPGGTNGAIQYNSGGSFGGAVLTGPLYGNGTSSPTAATSVQLISSIGGISSNQVWVGSGANAFTAYTLPSCSGSQQGLGWNTSSPGWSCNNLLGTAGTVTPTAIPKFSSSNTITSSSLFDNGTSIITAEALSVTSSSGITTPLVTTNGTTNGAVTLTYTGTPATSPTTAQAQLTVGNITTPGTFVLPLAPASGLLFGTNTAGVVQLSFDTATTAGSVAYYNGTTWTVLAGNTSGTAYLSENASGVPSWGSGGGGSVSNYYTSGVLTGIGGTSFTPTSTLEVQNTAGETTVSLGDPTNTNAGFVAINCHNGQTDPCLDISDQFGSKFTIDGNMNLAIDANVTTYAGASLAGAGLISNVGAVATTGQTASIGATQLISIGNLSANPNSPGDYEIKCAVSATAVTSTPTLTYTLAYTDDVGSKSFTGPSLTLSTSTPTLWNPVLIRAKNTTAVTIATTLTGTATYNFSCNGVRVR